MKRWIKRIVAAFSRGFASTIHYLYLARIPFLGWVTLLALPLLARHAGRPLILGAYDLSSNLQGFFCGGYVRAGWWKHLLCRMAHYELKLEAV
jgi:hypothetical protein